MAQIKLLNVNLTLQSYKARLEKSVARIFEGFTGRRSERSKRPGGVSAFSLKDINLTVRDGRTMVILRPSGCGKTTLLRMIAGLLTPDSGQVLYDGVDLIEIPAKDRGIGMVFQSYANAPIREGKTIKVRLRWMQLFDHQTGETIANPQFTD